MSTLVEISGKTEQLKLHSVPLTRNTECSANKH